MSKYTRNRSRRYKRKTKHFKGGQSGIATSKVVSLQSYPLNEGASSQRESSYISGQNATARHQSLLDTHGGRRRTKQKTQRYRKTLKRKYNHIKGGGSFNKTTTDVKQLIVPSFNTGNSISPMNATSLSRSGNILTTQSSANSLNDCYATNSCITQAGGQPYANWYDAYPGGSFGSKMTGGIAHK